MEIWAWIVAYIVGFSLLQLLVFRYFRNSETAVEQPSPGSSEGYAAGDHLEQGGSSEATPTDGIHCQQCGAYNEQVTTYRYCKKCASPLT